MLQRDREHLLGARHLKIERPATLAQHCAQDDRYRARDMAAILAQMRGDAVSARFKRNHSRARRIRIATAACVSDRRDVIDVHAETHARCSCRKTA
jgi:hypothetical protein